MSQNLSKIKEVMSVNSRGRDLVNEKLKSGKWVLLSVRTVEWNAWRKKQSGVDEAHLHQDYETIYVIGRIK